MIASEEGSKELLYAFRKKVAGVTALSLKEGVSTFDLARAWGGVREFYDSPEFHRYRTGYGKAAFMMPGKPEVKDGICANYVRFIGLVNGFNVSMAFPRYASLEDLQMEVLLLDSELESNLF